MAETGVNKAQLVFLFSDNALFSHLQILLVTLNLVHFFLHERHSVLDGVVDHVLDLQLVLVVGVVLCQVAELL